tara:strand:- start:35865 stop:36008 length:144 start_codon:yes stop_codon:yes gene_type:complete
LAANFDYFIVFISDAQMRYFLDYEIKVWEFGSKFSYDKIMPCLGTVF